MRKVCPFDDGKTCVNGRLTLGENIGDLGGLSMAYRAYKLSLNGKPAPVIDGLTGDQRFFLAYAQHQRGAKSRRARRAPALQTDPHSPDFARVNEVVRNFDPWYKAFNVKPGDKLYLPPEQRVLHLVVETAVGLLDRRPSFAWSARLELLSAAGRLGRPRLCPLCCCAASWRACALRCGAARPSCGFSMPRIWRGSRSSASSRCGSCALQAARLRAGRLRTAGSARRADEARAGAVLARPIARHHALGGVGDRFRDQRAELARARHRGGRGLRRRVGGIEAGIADRAARLRARADRRSRGGKAGSEHFAAHRRLGELVDRAV